VFGASKVLVVTPSAAVIVNVFDEVSADVSVLDTVVTVSLFFEVARGFVVLMTVSVTMFPDLDETVDSVTPPAKVTRTAKGSLPIVAPEAFVIVVVAFFVETPTSPEATTKFVVVIVSLFALVNLMSPLANTVVILPRREVSEVSVVLLAVLVEVSVVVIIRTAVAVLSEKSETSPTGAVTVVTAFTVWVLPKESLSRISCAPVAKVLMFLVTPGEKVPLLVVLVSEVSIALVGKVLPLANTAAVRATAI
jgi:hypothetical protein